MSTDRDRDASFERLLRRAPSLESRVPSPDCLSSDTIAAWADGSLHGTELAAAERHAAGCADCQAVLAAMARTEPAPAPSSWPRVLRWAAPLTAAAAAVSIWVLTQPPAPVPPSGMVAPDAATSSAPAAAPPAVQSRGEGAQASRDAAAARRVQPQPTEKSVPATEAFAPQVKPREEKLEDRAAANDAREQAAPPAPGAAAARSGAAGAVALPPAAGPPPVPSAAPASEPATLAETVSIARARQARADVDALSPNPSVRWRVGAAGLIQRSADGGVTWRSQTSGVTTDLVAAGAPSATVCWVVGRQGTVLLTTDGATWRRLAFPESADLVSVTAASATVADVRTADGRVFRTADGGSTWTLQEMSATSF